MTQPTTVTVTSAQEEILVQLALALEAADDPDSVVRQFVDRYPDHADAIRANATTERFLGFAAHPSPPARLTKNQRLGPFRIERFIAAGGMGEIYEAEQVDLKRSVALKVIRPDKADDQTRARFGREREVLAQLHQTHIVPVFASGEENGLQFYAMQYIKGASLSHVVDALKRPETLAAGRRHRGEGEPRHARGAGGGGAGD